MLLLVTSTKTVGFVTVFLSSGTTSRGPHRHRQGGVLGRPSGHRVDMPGEVLVFDRAAFLQAHVFDERVKDRVRSAHVARKP